MRQTLLAMVIVPLQRLWFAPPLDSMIAPRSPFRLEAMAVFRGGARGRFA
jgi:hypothetical protein